MTDPILHRPIPGPLYWDYRCMTCSQAVKDHASLFTRAVHALRQTRAHV